MQIKSTTSVFALTIASLAGPVWAQGLGGGQFYAGGGLDYGFYGFDTESNDFPGQEFESDGDATGVVLLGGYRLDSGSMFYGAEADFTLMVSSTLDYDDDWAGGDEVDCDDLGPCEVNWTSHIRGIVGYNTGTVEIFGAAGAAIHNVEFAHFGPDNTEAETVIGATVGAGVQFPLGSFDTRLEVLHDFALSQDWDAGGADYTTEWSATTIRAAAIFKF